MNMFKSRRKAKDQSEALEALTNVQSPPSTYKTVKNLKRKNKNIPEDTKPVFDLATALPDADDVRTSLLMSNLSARFSMLREQDDPNSKLGKASDDSVLFPKRASRLNLFNHNPLSDLTEVESIYSAIRPPFTERERSSSFGDGYDSESGSVMNRYRPGEGNTLFGGRQKFYKIPTSSARNVTSTDIATPTKQPCEHESSLAHFQQNAKKGKDAVETDRDYKTASLPATEMEDSGEIASPATTFSKNRGTQSSTTSAPRRTSTAATSVASESPHFRNSNSTEDEVTVKSTDRHSQVAESPSTLLISKVRDNSIPNRFLSQSKKSGHEKSQRPLPIYNSPSLRNASTPILPASAEPLDFGFKTESRSTSATGRYRTDSPTPSPIPESDNVLAYNVQPSDRGKATALGLFNKPAREFDEHQFNQRQLQMHEGQVASMSNSSRSVSRASNEALRARSNSNVGFTNPSQASVDTTSTPQVPPIPSVSASPAPGSHRTSKASGRGTPPLRPRSKSSASVTAVTNVKARIESLIRKQNAELAAMEAEKLGTPDSKGLEDPSENKENHAGAFFSDDDSDADESSGVKNSRANSSQIVDESHIHPAFRNSYRISDDHSRKSNYSNFSRTRSVVDDDRNDNSRLQVPKAEVDISAQQNGTGLSGLIRTHLRQDSDKSSIVLRPDSSVAPSIAEPSQRNSMASTARTAADSFRSDPFDLDLNRGISTPRLSQAPPTPTTAMSQVAQQFLSRAIAIKDIADMETTVNSPTVDDDGDESSEQKPWHEDMEPKHQRGGSSETTKERREFDEVLAARRRKIREGMKSVNERDRSQSPATASRGQSVTMQAFVQQRAVTDPQPKAMKMLGLQNHNGSSRPADTERGRHTGLRNETRGRALETDPNRQQTITYSRFDPEPTAEREVPARSATPPAIRHGRRDRSNSNVGHRSKSRTAQREPNVPMPAAHDYFGTREDAFNSSSTETREKPDPNGNRRNGYQGPRTTPPEITTKVTANHVPKPPALSPTKPFDSPIDASRPAMSTHSAGRTPPSSGRATPTSTFNRKRSVTKTMISEPTFVSSTSSVPLVRLPEAQQNPTISIPPLPMMNPRRRGNTAGESPVVSPIGPLFSRSPLEPVPASPVIADFRSEGIAGQKTTGSPSPRKLRKATSEGGSMAAKARHQAMAAELSHEKTRSPPPPMFPVRSATALGITDGGMF